MYLIVVGRVIGPMWHALGAIQHELVRGDGNMCNSLVELRLGVELCSCGGAPETRVCWYRFMVSVTYRWNQVGKSFNITYRYGRKSTTKVHTGEIKWINFLISHIIMRESQL